VDRLQASMENLFQADFQAMVSPGAAKILQEAVANGVYAAFVLVFVVSVISLCLVGGVPEGKNT
jgi:hypothetical protein